MKLHFFKEIDTSSQGQRMGEEIRYAQILECVKEVTSQNVCRRGCQREASCSVFQKELLRGSGLRGAKQSAEEVYSFPSAA